MEKKTFLGIDFTPRWVLRQRIAGLSRQLGEAREQLKQARADANMRDLKASAEAIALAATQKSLEEADRKVASLTKSLRKADGERIAALHRCADLARYERLRDSKGRFCKRQVKVAMTTAGEAPRAERLCVESLSDVPERRG